MMIISYSKEYLDYAISLEPDRRFGLDYPIGINMQALLDIYNMSLALKMDSLTKTIEPEINTYYSKILPRKIILYAAFQAILFFKLALS